MLLVLQAGTLCSQRGGHTCICVRLPPSCECVCMRGWVLACVCVHLHSLMCLPVQHMGPACVGRPESAEEAWLPAPTAHNLHPKC